MTKKIHPYIASGIIALALSSCAVPKVTDIKKPAEIPSTEVSNTATSTQSISLKEFFADPHLQQLFDEMVKANPDFLIAQQRLEIANSYLQRSKMALLPSLEVGAIVSGDHFGKYTIDGVGNKETNISPTVTEHEKINEDISPNFWLGAKSSWEIDAWGKLKNQKIAAQKRYMASAEGIRLLQVELFTNIAQLYYQLITLDKKLEIYEANLKLQNRAYEIVKAQREVGKATELAVQQFKAHNNNILAELEYIKAEIVSTEQAIATLTGKYGTHVERSSTLLPTQVSVLNQEMDVNAIIHSRPDVMSNYLVLEATHADAKAARAAFYPKLDLNASVGFNSFNAEMLFKPSSLAAQLLGGFMVPIFNKGQLKHEFNIANKEQEIAFLTYQKSITTAFNELQSVLKQMKIYEKVLKLKSEEVTALDKGIVVSNDLYLTGYANYLELINSQKSKLQAELERLQFQHQNTQNNILLFKALGGKL
ncbi:TolC family protein [Elizabethkingia sp. JS20170427COW]|uniref:TolC family protein n=1 Tax=Elizabethkingia sp. JS20170427COW TaxID=2583851 RepID=UPI0011109F18|nr:TolC family protein [Elizabethkingia sp. JS20170427COW]QCX53763.1 TolC family protein [Elizabethkingia sp. JS20170427COW]